MADFDISRRGLFGSILGVFAATAFEIKQAAKTTPPKRKLIFGDFMVSAKKVDGTSFSFNCGGEGDTTYISLNDALDEVNRNG